MLDADPPWCIDRQLTILVLVLWDAINDNGTFRIDLTV